MLTAVTIFYLNNAIAQVEMEGWGNINGIRVDGQLMEFQASISVVVSDSTGTFVKRTAKERQLPIYHRIHNIQEVSTQIDSLYINIMAEDTDKDAARVELNIESRLDTVISGIYFSIRLPARHFSQGKATIDQEVIDLGQLHHPIFMNSVSKLCFDSPSRMLAITLKQGDTLICYKDSIENKDDLIVNFQLMSGSIKSGDQLNRTFYIQANGEKDNSQAELLVDNSIKSRSFEGVGGNFRLHYPETDPKVINYCLENLRVAMARVEMPWLYWHQNEDDDPLENARKGKLHPRVKAAMEMAQRLGRMGIPVLVAIWDAPSWAIVGERRFGPEPGGLAGNPLDQQKAEKIYQSIADYIQYMNEAFGVKAILFSFNESDLGIYVRQTPEEHTKLIKELGAYFESRGLDTKLLLGDTADARGWEFLNDAIEDPSCHPYIGAVSFHSWRGWGKENLTKWALAADRLELPLIVGEASIDAAAWRYPKILQEPTYARKEIDLYIRILSICKPISILQWQLTADYSLLSGGGVYDNHVEPFRPTQRFWNLKQLASTPKGLQSVNITSNKSEISVAALAHPDKPEYVIHLVNNGPSRPVLISGLPSKLRQLHFYTTNEKMQMKKGLTVEVENGKAYFDIEAVSYISLTSKEFR